MLSVRPARGIVYVKQPTEEETTKGGLVIPEIARAIQRGGEVMAIGVPRITESGRLVPWDVNVGDQVIYSKYAGQQIEVDGQLLMSVKEEDLLGIIDGGKFGAEVRS